MTVTLFDSLGITAKVAFTTDPFGAPSYTDITPYVRTITTTYGGRSKGLDQFSPGTLSLELDNSDRRFDPLHAAGAYYPNVLPRKKIQVEATYSAVTYSLGTFFADGWPTVGEAANRQGICTLSATDGFKMLARNRLPIDPTNPVGAGERVDQRIGRLLDYAGWPAADRDLDTDSPTLIALVPNGQPVMGEIYNAANGDLGEVFIKPDGKFCYRGHRWQLANNLTASATFGDSGSELPYVQPVMTFDDSQIFNRATATATPLPTSASQKFDYSDAASITAYGESARDLGTVLVQNSNVVQNTLEWIVSNYKDAKLRVESLDVVRDARSTVAASLYPVVLGAQVGTRWSFVRRPQNVGSAITQDVIVQSVSHTITAESLRSTFMLAQAPTVGGVNYWIIGTSKLGVSGQAIWA